MFLEDKKDNLWAITKKNGQKITLCLDANSDLKSRSTGQKFLIKFTFFDVNILYVLVD